MKRICVIYAVILLFSAAAFTQSIGETGSLFKEGVLKGVSLSLDGQLRLYRYSDEFNSDTRDEYSIASSAGHKPDSLGYLGIGQRSGVYFSQESKKLFMEAGPGTDVGIEKTIEPLSDFYFSCIFTPTTVFTPNGETQIVLSFSDKTDILFSIPGHREQPVSASFRGIEREPVTSKVISGYSRVGNIGIPNGDWINSQRIFKPVPIKVIVYRKQSIITFRIGKTNALSFKQDSEPDLTSFSFIISGQETLLDNIELISLEGSFTTAVREGGPVHSEAALDIVSNAEPEDKMVSVEVYGSGEFKTLLDPEKGTPVARSASFPFDITEAVRKHPYYCIRYNLSASPSLLIKGGELPVIKYSRLK